MSDDSIPSSSRTRSRSSSSQNTKSDTGSSSMESPIESPIDPHFESDCEHAEQHGEEATAVGYEDDFVLVELRPAFCADMDDVGSLFRQCQSPLTLDIFTTLEKEDEESESIDLDTQLEKYRKELQHFDDYFKTNIY